MAKATKRTKKLRSRNSSKDIRHAPKSVTARAAKRAKFQRESAVLSDDDDDNVPEVTATQSKPMKKDQKNQRKAEPEDGGFAIEKMDVDEFLSGDFMSDDLGDITPDDVDQIDDDDNDNEQDEIARHANELKMLERTDPEFFKHLQANQKELLEFGHESDNDQSDPVEKHDPVPEPAEQGESCSVNGIDRKAMLTLIKTARLHSLRSLKRLLRIFRHACHISDDSKDEGKAGDDAMRMADPATFDLLIRATFKDVPKLVLHHLHMPDGETNGLKRSSHWKTHESMIRSFLGNAIHFLSQCVDESVLRYGLSCLQSALPLLVPLPKLCQKYLKLLLHIWSHSADLARVEAFIQLRQLTLLLASRPAFLDAALKGIYLTFVRNAKFVTAVNAPLLRFMMNCVVELYAIDPNASYQHAFVYLRQIAIHIRGSVEINAQLMSSLSVWGMVISTHCKNPDSPLFPLIYPFSQIALAMIGAHGSCKYFPLHLQCVASLESVHAATGVYIPLSTPLLSIICSTAWPTCANKVVAKPQPIDHMIAAPTSTLKTRQFQESVVNRAITLLRLHLTTLSRCIGFPELAGPIRRSLMKFAQTTKVVRFRKGAQKLSAQILSNMNFIESQRSEIDFAPKDVEKVREFSAALPPTPLEAYSLVAGDDSANEGKESLTSDHHHDASVEEDDQEEDVLEEEDDDDDSVVIDDEHCENDDDPEAEDKLEDFVLSSDEDNQ